MKEFRIGKRKVGGNQPVLIVAEMSGNHRQRFSLAVKTIRAIKRAGADAVKLQTYTPETITLQSPQPYFRIKQGTIWDGKTLHQLYQETYTPWEWQPKLKRLAEDLGLICFSSPFDRTAVDFLAKLKMPAYKVASFEITDLPLIEYLARKNKPVLISTGIARAADISRALKACYVVGNRKIALLQCTSAYPAPLEQANLMTLPALKRRFKTIVGLSDHTLEVEPAVAAVALGAKIVEKHFILERSLGGADAPFSLEPREFSALVASIRKAEKALGKVCFSLSSQAKRSREFARSLFVVEDMTAGEAFSLKNVRSIRPGFGLPPRFLPDILKKRAARAIKKGTPLFWGLIKT